MRRSYSQSNLSPPPFRQAAQISSVSRCRHLFPSDMAKPLLIHRSLGILKPLAKISPPCDFSTPLHLPTRRLAVSGSNTLPLSRKFPPLTDKVFVTGGKISAFGPWTQGSPLQVHDESPVSIELKSICNENEFDKVITDAEERNEPVILVWMASWCRKCIYLKPKLERLAADYYPRLQFYCVDVNMVSHKLVAHAGVALWKDGEKQDEVIGGYKEYLVANEVQKMIESELTCE